MCKVIAIANQKGGVSKTCTCVNLGAALVRSGRKVCVLDADPQGILPSHWDSVIRTRCPVLSQNV